MEHENRTDRPAKPPSDWRVLRRLLGYLRPYPVPMAGALGAVIANSLLQLAPPYLTKVVIDRFISSGSLAGIAKISRLYLITLGAAALLECAQTYVLQLTAQRVMYDLRLQLYRHLQRLDLQFFDRNPVGRLMTRVTTDVEVLNDLFTSGVHAIFFDLFTLAGIVGVLLAMNWRLALVTLAVVPLVALLTQWFRRNVRESFREVRSWVARLNAYLQENIVGVATVQLFRREEVNLDRFRALDAGHRDANLKAVFYYAVFYPAIEIIATVSTASLLWYGGAGVLHGRLTLGLLVAFLLYAQRFFRPVADISEKLNGVQAAIAASERIFGLLDSPFAIRSPRQPVFHPARGGVRLVFDRVSFAYDEADVIKNVSFDVSPGERVGIVGATGSGKSTIINLLLRFYDVRQGRILIDGVDVRQMDLAELRSLFGLVLQEVQLFSGSIASNVRFGDPRVADAAVKRAIEAVGASRFVDRLPAGMNEAVAERGSTLSTGQKQLISFARALAFDRPVLILDEATSSIDTETELMIRDALDAAVVGRTTIAIAHRLSTILAADQILVVDAGRIAERGTHAELLALGGLYTRLYEEQFRSATSAGALDRKSREGQATDEDTDWASAAPADLTRPERGPERDGTDAALDVASELSVD